MKRAVLILSIMLFSLKSNADPLYLDYQASTPVDQRVMDAMTPYFTEKFGNPHSSSHIFGMEAHEAIEQARKQVAGVINADPDEIIFTSGATEANNLALFGVAHALKEKGKTEIISVVTEHKSVLEPLKILEKEGFKVTILPVQANGIINIEDLKKAMTSKTALVSVMAANNEIGVLQPIQEIAQLAHQHGALFHTDAAQAFGKIPLDVKKNGIDLLSLSGHKIYGPKGIGALYVKKGVEVVPLTYGGGQERGIRPGTVATPLVVGLGKASEIAKESMKDESERLVVMRNNLLSLIQKDLNGVIVNGDLIDRLPGNLNISFTGVDTKPLLDHLKHIAVSGGSACTSDKDHISYVIHAIDKNNDHPPAVIRIGIGRFTTEDDIFQAAAEIVTAVNSLRGESPEGGKRICHPNK